MQTIKPYIQRLIPEALILLYHGIVAFTGALYYGFPTRKLFVIGITGTKGKTSSANFIWSVLNTAGFKTGLIGTANIRIGEIERMNEFHMTMPGRWHMQKLFKEMVAAGCTHVVFEVTSDGLKQNRHWGIFFDVGIFTNLTPDHLSSHGGSFEKYKQAKGKLFKNIGIYPKKLAGEQIKSAIIVNADSPHASYFANNKAAIHMSFGCDKGEVSASQIRESRSGVSFVVDSTLYEIKTLGSFNVYNALPALCLAKVLKIDTNIAREGLLALKTIPGRMEKIDQGQPFTVIVDYAHERASITALLSAARTIAGVGSKLIVVIGGAAGARDTQRWDDLGTITGKESDIVIVTTDDPYNTPPEEIIETIALQAAKEGKVIGKTLFTVVDRREAIRLAFSNAGFDDIVLIAGKGAEQAIVVRGVHLPWDDRSVAREELQKLLSAVTS